VYRELIQSLYTFDWIAEKKIIVAFMNLVSLFVSSNPIFLIPSLQMLVKNLVPQLPSSPGLPETPTASLSEEYFLELKQRQEFLHRTIQIIFRLAPGAMLEIHPILVDNFPHKRLSCHVQQEYVTQLLLLCESFPQLQGRIIELIFTKCLELDVDIVIEDSGEVHISAEADEDDEASEFFQLDDNPDQDSFKSLRRRAGMGEEGAMKIRDDVSETAQKLDSILAILLSFIRATQERSEALATPETDPSQLLSVKLFKQMLDAFELRVMTTYKAKYVQFALFYSCQLSPPLGLCFPSLTHNSYPNTPAGVIYLQRLSRLFLDPSNHPLSRQSAVVYLSSLIARGQFISFHTSR
jgi:RNA polymerase I-specific transcription initiation factor RRN3